MSSLLQTLCELEGQADQVEEAGERKAQALLADARAQAQAIHKRMEGEGRSEAEGILAASRARREQETAAARAAADKELAALREAAELARPRALEALLARLAGRP